MYSSVLYFFAVKFGELYCCLLLKMNEDRQMEVHYIDTGFPYTTTESFMDFFEGLHHHQVPAYGNAGPLLDQVFRKVETFMKNDENFPILELRSCKLVVISIGNVWYFGS